MLTASNAVQQPRAPTSFCTVSDTFKRRECGSVQMNSAFTRRTLLSPLTLAMHNAIRAGDSGAATTHRPFRLYLRKG